MKRIIPVLLLGLVAAACQNEEPTLPSHAPQFSGTYDDPAGMVSYWRFDEGSGAIAYDDVDDNDGTILGGATWVDGVCGQALSFDGVDDYVDAGNDLSLNGDIVTVELWVKPYLKREMFIGKGIWREDGWFLEYHDPNVCDRCLALFISNSGDRTFLNTPNNSVTPDAWSFITFVLTRSDIRIFVDGDLSAEYHHSFNYWMNPDRHLFVGLTKYPGYYFKGLIDEVAIYDRALTAEEIRQRYEYTAAGCAISVAIDIEPGRDPNIINPKSNGVVPVAILGSDDFDVTDVDVTTLAFGPDGALPAHDLTDPDTYNDHLEDVNNDGYVDLVSHYRQKEMGLGPDDTEACVTGATTGGTPIEGCDAVRVLDK